MDTNLKLFCLFLLSASFSILAKYWEKVKPVVNGMLGGYGHIHPTDIESSTKFLNQYFSKLNKRKVYSQNLRAADCGAGIGRISLSLLVHYFHDVDMFEPNEKFLNTAMESAKKKGLEERVHAIQEPLQSADLGEKKYDVVWIQWVVGYLTDEHLISFFQRCQRCLRPNGVVILKDNISSSDNFILDDEDASIVRCLKHMKSVIARSGLEIVSDERVKGYPTSLLPVYLFALR